MPRKPVLIATVAVLLVATVAGCGADQEQGQQQEDGATPEQTATEETLGGTVEETHEGVAEETTVMEGTVAEGTTPTTTSEVVRVGGFTVERPDGTETTVPEVTAERQEVEGYRAQVQPIIEGTVRDVSDLVQADVSLDNGNLSLDVEVASLEEARQSARDSLEQLRRIAPPENLEPIHQRLISAYEQVLPAYDEIIEAADSGDPRRMSDAVRENLPRIEAFNEETRAILQDLDQAATSE